MYLAPLNYDKYFRKVFSNVKIAKRFLEDFLETRVNKLEILKGRHRVTDDASLVEFDFRCHIENAVVILDMQQWYKRGIVQRFYLYHALNTGLQLEDLSDKRVIYESSYKTTEEAKDYRALHPVLTLIWMADDSLDFTNDYVAYSMTPELVAEFVENDRLWHKQEIIELLKEREKVLEVLRNTTKDLDFLSKNRLIFMLQKNIVKNKTDAKYRKWFDFAQKTKNPDNKKEDFLEYMDDEIFRKIIKRLNKEELTEDDFLYIADEKEKWEQVERYERGVYEYAVKDIKYKIERDGMEAFLEKEAGKKKALEIARKLKDKGFDNDFIADISGLPPVEITLL